MCSDIPQYIQKLCTDNIEPFPAPYEYTLYQSKHIPEGQISLFNKAEQIKKFILKNHGEFNIISETPHICGKQLQMRLFFNCDVVIAKQLDKIIGC